MKIFIPEPNRYINHPTRKKRAALLIAEAMKKTEKSILNAPAEMVKTLYGMGVKPAIPTAHALYRSYRSPTAAYWLVKP